MNDRHPEARAPATWHPVLMTVEAPTGTWRVIDTLGREYGVVRLLRLDGEPRYRTEHRGELLGYEGTLFEACWRVHRLEIQRGAHTSTVPNSIRYSPISNDYTSPPRQR